MAYKAYHLLARRHARKAVEAIPLVGPLAPYYPETDLDYGQTAVKPLLWTMRIQAPEAIADSIANAVRAIDGAKATPADLAHGPRGTRLWDPVKQLERVRNGKDFTDAARAERPL